MGELRRRLIAAQPHLVTASGETLGIAVAEPKLNKLAVTFAPVQSGSGTPSPSNVRPISGWTDIAVQMCGKNLFDSAHADAAEKKIKNDSGTEITDNGGSYTRLYTPVKPSTTYTVSAFTASNSKRVYFYTSEKAWISRTSSTTAMSITFTTPSNCYYVQFQSGSTVNEQWNIQLELGSTATTYEPYRGISPSISLGGTYYGGTVDLVSGTMTVTKYGFTGTQSGLDIRMDSYGASYVTSFFVKSTSRLPTVGGELISSRFSTTISSGTPGRMVNYGDNIFFVTPRDDYSGTPTAAATKQWLVDHPTTFVYTLATPQTISLSPQTILALRGQQTVTSPAGSVEIGYWAFDDTVRQMSYGGIPVYRDNAYFPNGGGTLAQTGTDSDWFIAGPFDTGATTSKSITYLYTTEKPAGQSAGVCWRVFNDQTGQSVDFWGMTSTTETPRTINSAGRYIYASIKKSKAPDQYMTMTVGGVTTYLYKGNNVT